MEILLKILPGNEPQIVDKAPSGKIYLDGSINVETDSQSIKERKKSINEWLFRDYSNCFK